MSEQKKQDARTAGIQIREMPAGTFCTLEKVRPSGALQARRQASGAVSFYWRYSIGLGSERVRIGFYDPLASPKSLQPNERGFSVAAAVHAAEAMAMEHDAHRFAGGRPALLKAKTEAKKKVADAEREAKQKSVEAARHAAESTLERLLTAYCDHLESLGRSAHKDARSIFRLHVVTPWPAIAKQPANQLTGEQVLEMMRLVLKLGKGRTANKLRSYVRAAFQTARASRSKASIPVHFKAFNVVNNPADDTEPEGSENKSAKNPLSLVELRDYWRAIRHLAGFRGS
ncbi:MAG: putative phage integrase/recombinase protein, partial [Ramlibacter sp.]|nr:putative phage integrase/recombinase protein [Ramlibacter sp.]